MIQFPYKIPVAELGRGNRLYNDYVSRSGSLIDDILGGYARSRPVWEQNVHRFGPVSAGEAWHDLVDGLVAYNASLGAGDEVIDKLHAAKSGGVRFVVTGQQPGVLGGALLTLHKINTAVSLAEHVERTFNVRCLPLYWMGADDADFQEIRELFLVDCDLSPLATAIDGSAWKTASPVGDIPVAAEARVWKSVEPVVAKCPFKSHVSALVHDALEGAVDHGEVTARILSAALAGRIVVVDGREPLVRRCARDLFLRFFDAEAEVNRLVSAAGKRLESAGYHAQVQTGPDSGVFRVEDGMRKKIVADRRHEAREAMARDVGGFSPGVVLRNLVQDHVFRPAAVVLGPAEIAYRAQLGDVYPLLGIQPPVAFPRMTATWLSTAVSDLLRAVPSPDVVRLLADTPRFVKDVYEAERRSGAEEAAAHFRRVFADGSGDFLAAIAETMDDRAVRKTRKRLEDVSRRLDRVLDVAGDAGKNAALSNWPFLEGLDGFISRNTRPQDRYLSCLAPYLFAGEKAAAAVAGAADAFVDGALDGRTPHVVYCV